MTIVSDDPREANAHWPDGWFVFGDGEVSGPFSAQEAFELSPKAEDGKPRLVSRKGFTQWYHLQDLASVYRLTDSVAESIVKSSNLSHETKNDDDASGSAVAAPVRDTDSFDPSSDEQQEKTHVSAVRPRTSADQHPDTATKESQQISTLTKPKAQQHRVVKRNLAPQRNQPVPASRVAGVSSGVLHEYIVSGSRLRLGKLRNPWVAGLFGVTASFGFYWFVWARDALHELSGHGGNDVDVIKPSIWLAFLPGLHLLFAFRLAQCVRVIEMQNHYATVSPMTAALIAIWPPFAVTYLQDAMNRHWLLHARYAQKKKAKEKRRR